MVRLGPNTTNVTRTLEMETSRIIPWVFHRKGQRIRSCRSGWEKAREDAAKARGPLARGDLADRLVNDLRRWAVRNLERAGVPRLVAMRLTGHKSDVAYRRYAIVAKSDLGAGLAKLAELHGERATG